GAWGNIPVTGSKENDGSLILKATPLSPLGPLSVDEINLTVSSLAGKVEGDLIPINISVMAGGVNVTGPVTTVYPLMTKKNEEVGGGGPINEITDFATVRGRYTSESIVQVSNK